ncbi:MAG: magnesium/cobalt transporter CorA [Geobacteraceae bacterium]|nr:magnesium/cobalt transporter CorA [Geobacteraceae bacterium]
MKKIIKPRKGLKAGASPGTLVHVGEVRQSATTLTVAEYGNEKIETRRLDPENLKLRVAPEPVVTWVDVEGISDLPLMEKIGAGFGFHPLVLEDIVNTDQRPKSEDYETYLFMVVKMFTPSNEGTLSEQISLLLGSNWLVTFQEGLDGDPFAQVRDRLKNPDGRLRTRGADYLCYALIDAVVDNYFLVLEDIANRIEDLEEELMNMPTPETLARLYRLKREVLLLHRSIWPLREVVSALIRRESPLVKETTVTYLRDLYDHTIQVIETTETLRDMLSGMLDIYLSSVSNRMNAIMKVLTIIATIFMPLTFIAGLYGMNFKHMPELEYPLGYPIVLVLMAGVTIGMLIFFRKKRWL